MEERITKLLFNEYNIIVDKLSLLEGGYRPDEIYLLVTSDQVKYIVKYIVYHHSFEHLESILKFENILHDLYKYSCPQIILSNKQQFVIKDNNRFLFVQTFIEGIEPTREILDKDDSYLHEMGRLLAQWRIASREYSINFQKEKDQQLTNEWWEKQQMDNVDPFLLSNLLQCKEYLINLNGNFESGLIHNDFHTNNSLMTKDGKIFIIDFVDACQALFVSDLATSLFHLLIDKQNGIHRAKIFLQGYQQILQLISEEINVLDMFVRFKLTVSIIDDLLDSVEINQPFIELCFYLLHTLNNDSTLVKNLLQ
jgi:Ser/Thr protein kinase RdoA (MazF antagonist)